MFGALFRRSPGRANTASPSTRSAIPTWASTRRPQTAGRWHALAEEALAWILRSWEVDLNFVVHTEEEARLQKLSHCRVSMSFRR